MMSHDSPDRHMIILKPQVLVHGEQNEMARLKAALMREYEDNEVVLVLKVVEPFQNFA